MAIESRGGVAIAGDTRAVDGETVTGQHVQRVFDFDTVGAGVVGNPGDIQDFQRHLADELRSSRLQHGDEIGLSRVARIAARQAHKAGVSAAVAARDPDGIARLREVGPDGRALESSTIALGDGAEIAFGQLGTVDSAIDLEEAVAEITDILKTVTRRDSSSGGTIDVWSLSNAPASDTGDGT